MTAPIKTVGCSFTPTDRFLQYNISHKIGPLLKLTLLSFLMFSLRFKFLHSISHVLGITDNGNQTWLNAAHPTLIIPNY